MERSRGTYAQDPRITEAQAKLYDEYVHTDQVVWCSLDEPRPVPLDQPQFVHTIEVDQRDIVAVLDGFIWEHIVGNSRCVPPDERQRMRCTCCIRKGRSYQQELAALEDRYIAEHLPSNLWGKVLAADLTCRIPQILIRWPFDYSGITHVSRVHDGEGVPPHH
jgi:hypothetical protein